MKMEYDDEEIYLLNGTNGTDQTSSFSEPESLNVIIPLTIIYIIIFIAGVLGNISTCVVIGRNRSMHTATNFYLFSLAISDLLLLLCGLPLEVYRLWKPLSYPLGEVVCITFGLISETSANATVLTITAFTVERYIAICRPFISHTMSKSSRAVRYIILICICALCAAVPQAMQFGVVTYSEKGQNISACTVKGHGVHQVFVTSSFVFFVVPMSLITVLYALIGVKLRSSHILHIVKKPSDESKRFNGAPRFRNGASQRKVIRMLVAVALSFFLCWAPFHVQRLIAIYGKNLEHPTDTFYKVYIVLTYLSGVLYFLSTAINPFLYNIMSNKFRNAFKVTLSKWCRRGGSRLERSYSAILASQRHRVAIRAAQRQRQPPNSRLLRRLSTASSQLYDAPPIAQSYHRSDLTIVKEVPDVSWIWKQHPPERSDSCTSPRSISNSSLHELDKELSREELATFMYQVNCNIGAIT
ncbi:pyrokinin-1 receptor-like isoform X1 [Vanessa tameamea]|uniref:Pyrokinin-1 receptor-like isoform X1 n=1 Tax=Vanessa tameamea TaxID=334116 RepID=A0A8B8HK65_VANTA